LVRKINFDSAFETYQNFVQNRGELNTLETSKTTKALKKYPPDNTKVVS